MKNIKPIDICISNIKNINTGEELSNNISIESVDMTGKRLEELIRAREVEKNKKEMNMSKNKHKNISNDKLGDIKNIQINNDIKSRYLSEVKCSSKKTDYNYTWDAYWPLIGSGSDNPRLEFILNYITYNGRVGKKWTTTLPTPITDFFPAKELLNININNGSNIFDFNIHFENIPASENSVIIDINPKSTTFPFNLNQYILIKDPNIISDKKNTNIMGVIAQYNTNKIYHNQFTGTFNNINIIKNILFSSQLFFIHINQISEIVNLSIVHNTSIGENLFKILIKTNSKVEIKEIPISMTLCTDNDSFDVNILQKIIYINEKYFMTYATYINDISSAIKIADYINDPGKTPIQLVTMLLFNVNGSMVDLNTIVPNTEHERILTRLYKDILKNSC